MNSTALQTWLAANAAGMTDAAAAVALNWPATATQLAPLNAVKLLLYQDATPCAMLRIAAAAEAPDTTVAGLQMAAMTANAFLNDPHMEHLDFTLASVQGMLALLVAGNVLSQALVTSIEAVGSYTTTVAAATGIVPNGGFLRPSDVTRARAAS